MKKALFFISIISITVFPQSKFAIEAGGGIDLVTNNDFNSNIDNGYSIMISPVFNFNETIMFMASFAFHRVEGTDYYEGIVPAIYPYYSIDNPLKPNINTYDFSLGMRANFSEKQISPYFVVRTGFLFTDFPLAGYNYLDFYPGYIRKNDRRIAFYFSPGLGVNFRLLSYLSILLEGRFIIKTGNEYSYIPFTTSLVYNF
jgi:Outer membrane protein beta-barrel domain